VFVNYWFYHLSVIPLFTNSCINPFIYAAKYGEFQKGVRRMMARLFGGAQEIHPQQNPGGIRVVAAPVHQHPLDTGVTWDEKVKGLFVVKTSQQLHEYWLHHALSDIHVDLASKLYHDPCSHRARGTSNEVAIDHHPGKVAARMKSPHTDSNQVSCCCLLVVTSLDTSRLSMLLH